MSYGAILRGSPCIAFGAVSSYDNHNTGTKDNRTITILTDIVAITVAIILAIRMEVLIIVILATLGMLNILIKLLALHTCTVLTLLMLLIVIVSKKNTSLNRFTKHNNDDDRNVSSKNDSGYG